MFLKTPKYSRMTGNGKFISRDTVIRGAVPAAQERLKNAFTGQFPEHASYASLSLSEGVPDFLKRQVWDCFSVRFSEKEEAYAIAAAGEAVKIYSQSKRGLLYGALHLIQLAEEGFLSEGLVYEAPVCDVRGAKVYLPGRNGIAFFKEFVDLLCECRMNTVMLEIGGAMEYKRHPEINEGWKERCAFMSEYSGKTIEIQDQTFDFKKNSIHVENGDGSFLTQDEVREMLAYCHEKYMNVIPEVPSLSHCDYLLTRHHELAERQDDPYADTYCPSDERSYALLFDVLDEIIDVFSPAMINIGHDEFYTVGICEKCREKDPVSIYAEDIRRIYTYLKEKNIKTMLWSEKFLNAFLDGRPVGGAEGTYRKGFSDDPALPVQRIPAMHTSIDRIPADLEMLHWYWSIGDGYDEEYHKRGLMVTYGNFSPVRFARWRERTARGIRGAIISNWSSFKEENLQRNGKLYEYAYANRLFWEDDYSEDLDAEYQAHALESLYRYRCRNIRHGIRITHSTEHDMEYTQFYDGYFIVPEKYDLGRYQIAYADGKTAFLPVIYGQHIANGHVEWEKNNAKIAETSYTTLPQKIKTEDGELTVYEVTYENQNPGIPVRAVKFIPNPAMGVEVILRKFEVF